MGLTAFNRARRDAEQSQAAEAQAPAGDGENAATEVAADQAAEAQAPAADPAPAAAPKKGKAA